MTESLHTRELLDGLRVVEASTSLTGAQVGQFLADFGAEVILVEQPGGSPLRRQPAFPLWARRKKSVELDLATPDGRESLHGLLAGADVLVETFRPSTRRRFGLERATDSHPRLVQASITGFGSQSPLADAKGYEALVLAKVGGLSAFSGMAGRPGPAYVSVPFASWSATQTALQGILAALYERETSGQGQTVEANLAHSVGALDPWGWMVHWLTLQYSDAFTAAPPVGEDGVPNSSFTFRLLVALTADGRWLQFSQVQPRLFRALMRALELDWMFDDPEWSSAPEFEDPARRVEFWEILLSRVRAGMVQDWQKVFEADHDVWAEVFRHGTELLHHPQMVHNGMVAEFEDRRKVRMRQPGPLVKVFDRPAYAGGSAPDLDEHRQEVLESSAHMPVADRPGGARSGRLPLDGVTVLELGTFYAAPYGATILTDLGARVIKIEPLEGDPMRTILPFPESGGSRVLQGKESVALDMATEEGRRIIEALAVRSDIVLQCFRAGVAERLKVDPASLRQVNPDLVYLHAPGYGIDGPNGHCPAFAPTIGAGAGFAWRNVGAAVADGPDLTMDEIKRNSLRLTAAAGPQFAQADGVSAVAVATALALGLLARRRGSGARVMMTTMLSSAAHALSEDMVEYEGRPPILECDPGFFGLSALYRLYEASDGWVFLAAPNETEWAPLVEAMSGQADLSDPRFSDPDGRREADESLAETLATAFRSGSAAEWEEKMLRAGVGCVAVAPAPPEGNYLGEFGRRNGYVVDVEHPIFGPHPRMAPMVRFSRSSTVAKPGCSLGQHTAAVLREIGYSDERIRALEAEGLILGA